MFAYIFLSLLSYVVFFLSSINIYKRLRTIFYYFLVFILFLFSSLRYEVGVDFELYKSTVSNPYGYEFDRLEIFYKLLIMVMHYTGLPYQTLFIVSSAIYMFSFAIFNKKYFPLPFLSLLFFIFIPSLYLASFNLIRQFAAIGIFLIGFKFLLERKFFRYCLVLLVASLFHKSAILLVFAYFIINNVKLTLLTIVLLFILTKPILFAIYEYHILPSIYLFGFESKGDIITKTVPLFIIYNSFIPFLLC